MKIRVQKKHALAIRWNHWVHFPLLTIMIWSGLMIYWAYPSYFLPESILRFLNLEYRLGEGIGWHFSFAYFFALNGLIYIVYLLFSGQWRYIFPDRNSLRESWAVFLHDLGIQKRPLPFQLKYNAAQRLAYTGILFLGAAQVITGFAIYKPIRLGWLITLLGGYQAARLEHFLITILFILFFIVHVTQVVRAGWKNFRSMVTGLEEANDK